MKTYFKNFPYTVESLKKEFRAYSLTMHPDRGGNAEEFADMQNEYNSILRNVDGTAAREAEQRRQEAAARAREEEEERRRAEAEREAERKAREEEERRERERIEKLQEENRAAVRAWSAILERIPDGVTTKKRAYDFTDDKARAAYVAATKRNIKAVINHYFPGLKVKVSISGRIWREDFTISWQDGPSIDTLRDTCKELDYFIPSYYASDPYADYGDYYEHEETAPWREAYGQALGDVTNIDFTRGLSDEGKQQAEELAAQFFANFDPKSEAETFAANLEELGKFAKVAGFYDSKLTDIFRSLTGNYYGDMYGVWSEIKGEVNRRQLRKVLAEYVRVNVTPKEKAPEFAPTYGPVYKAIKKALGANVLYIEVGNSRKNSEQELTIFEAAERLARGEAVQLGKRSTFDDDPVIYGTDRGGYKTQQKRAEKFEAVGIILEGVSYNTYGHIIVQGIKPETLEALRREAADIERQRKEWEEAQKAPQESAADHQPTDSKAGTKNAPTADSKADSKAEGPDLTKAPADGLRLVALEGGGVAVVADDWKTTYFNKRYIKAHGAHWNKDAKQWQATDPDDIVKLRAWFFFHGKPTDQGTTFDEVNRDDEPTTPDPDDISTDTTATADTDDTSTDTTATADTGATADTLQDSAEISPLFEAVAGFFGTLARISREAAKWEGVTIPAATLQRWHQETTNGANDTAARFAEVCACLSSLTPDSREKFDALGVIFWTLSQQIKNGTDPATIAPAVDFARAQLFDLVDVTQNPRQAAAVRRAFDPNSPADILNDAA